MDAEADIVKAGIDDTTFPLFAQASTQMFFLASQTLSNFTADL